MGLLLGSGACGPRAGLEPAQFLPMPEAIARQNANHERIAGRLYVEGSWRGHLRDDAGTRRHLDGRFKMHFASPDRLSFKADAGLLTNRLFEAGCVQDVCWYWEQFERDVCYVLPRSGISVDISAVVPIQPQALMDALGLHHLETDTSGFQGARYRVTPDHHQLIYEAVAARDQVVIIKEYWLSRRSPFLLERVVYRQPDGQVEMEALLTEHRPIGPAGPQAPHRIEILMPLEDSRLLLELDELELREDIENIWLTPPWDRPERERYHKPPGEIIHL